eukprot:jgi/Psemu1/260028/estExt_Genewise1Plus.C_4080020
MRLIAFVADCRRVAILLLLGVLLILHQDTNDRSRCSFFSHAKEIEPTKEWQKVEGNDTIPAGAHVKMDMTTGEKWVKLMSEDDKAEDNKVKDVHIQRNAGGSHKSSVAMAVVEADGTVNADKTEQNKKPLTKNSTNYDFDMMYRTLSKLPPEEIVAMGGLPEPPDSKEGPSRSAFEERMLEIWKKRQAELLEMQLNFPEILKARIAGINDYIADPETQLESVDLNADEDDSVVTDIVSLLKDLEFQLSDIDMARDFHTMEGWTILVQLLAEETHIPINKTINEFSRNDQAKIRTIQSHAAWAIGTAVKNTEEFFPYSIEPVALRHEKLSTAIDLVIDIFCQKYDDSNSWEIRTLLAKAIYAIGAMLRGNPIAQTHVAKSGGFDSLGKKFKKLSEAFTSANIKLIQRMAGFSTDIVEDLLMNNEFLEESLKTKIVSSLSSSFCEATCELFSSEKFIPVTVQEALVKGIGVLGPFCQISSCTVIDFRSIIEKILADWVTSKEKFDEDHFGELQDTARRALESLSE